VLLKAMKRGLTVVAMILIYLLIRQHLGAGGQGIPFVAGVAAIAGLGGYELKNIIEVVRRRSENKKQTE